ncbi:MAG: 3-phosphoshikimate 1-carboxyvinyltransferase [Chitinophagaceae bacterium]|nr:3-phosphoshikimate 1-carboxyvinyltransferase [Chitinophagaceae bacterium]
MKVSVNPSELRGIIQAPPSKSCMQRACAAALLRKGVSYIFNPGYSADDEAAINIIQKLGAEVHKDRDGLRIISNGIQPNHDVLDCGESGLSIRMFTPLAALSDRRMTITGSGSLTRRPIHFFEEILPKLNVYIQTQQGKLPLVVKGPLQAKNIEVDGSLSSQFLTGLLMAYSISDRREENTVIKVNNLKSKPYISLTLEVMRHFGLAVPENRDFTEFVFSNNRPQSVSDHPVEYDVEGDWSGAAFLLVAGAIRGHITVRGLNVMSHQADKAIVEVLTQAQAALAYERKSITIHTSDLIPFGFDATDCPDLFPPLAVLALHCKGTSRIKGVHRLEHKESNRTSALLNELGKMGGRLYVKDDELMIEGGNRLRGAEVHSHHDHRIAMACAVAALIAEGTTTIDGAESVKKSYPHFFNDLKQLGAHVQFPSVLNYLK